MKILLVSSQWSETRKTGLGFASSIHKEVLESLGFTVISVGNINDKTNYEFKNSGRVDLLIKYFKFHNFIKDIIIREKPEFIVVESLQNIFSEISIIVAKKLKKKIVLISHGVSIFPYKLNFKYILRFLIWIPYIFFIFLILKKVNIFLNFDNRSKNLRHFDLFIYKNILRKEKFYEINNFSRFEKSNYLKSFYHQNKNKIILSFGYLNHIKNQLDILKIANEIRDNNIIFRIIYSEYNCNYLKKLKNYIKEKKMTNIELINSQATNLNEEIKNCYFFINTSITEVMPLTIFEAMEKGKIYLSYDVGSVSKISEVIVSNNFKHMIANVQSLLKNESLVINSSVNLQKNYYKKYSITQLKKKFKEIFC